MTGKDDVLQHKLQAAETVAEIGVNWVTHMTFIREKNAVMSQLKPSMTILFLVPKLNQSNGGLVQPLRVSLNTPGDQVISKNFPLDMKLS